MSRKQRRARPAPSAIVASPPSAWRTAALLFAFALALRVLFWQATADSAWPYSAAFKGDAVVWLDYARAVSRGREYELGLPIHPPGTAYLVAALWNGRSSGFFSLRLVWCLLGAVGVTLLYGALRRDFGERPALFAAGLAAGATSLLLLSSSIDSELPYLVLALTGFWLVGTLREGLGLGRLLAWAAVSGLACLFRVEHVAFFLATLAWLCWGWVRRASAAPTRLATLAGAALLAFALPLVPWHASTWAALARFDDVPPIEQGPQAALTREVTGLSWDDDAARWRETLPAFARPTGASFVAATVIHQGRARVSVADTALLDQAFGYTPRALTRHPFVSLYGPLNFALANRPGSNGGFSTALLEQPPPLRPNPASYPPALVAGLPPPQLALVYPPHLWLVNEGYAIGLGFLRSQPGEALRLFARKLRWFWAGAASGFGGYNLPLGLSGTRRAVDLVVADPSPWSAAWRLALLGLAAAGLWAGRRAALFPWIAWAGVRLLAAAAFFGYARLGAGLVPVLALLCALAAERWLWPRLSGTSLKPERLFVAAALLLLGAEAWRCASHPELRVDGRPITSRADPFPFDLHRDQALEVR